MQTTYTPAYQQTLQTPAVETARGSSGFSASYTSVRISKTLLCSITRQLAMLLRAGMPLVQAIRALQEQFQNSSASTNIRRIHKQNKIAAILGEIADAVCSGQTLATAMSRYPEIFSNLYTSMVRAGQETGLIEQALIRVSETFEKQLGLAGKIKAAIAYPAMMLIVAVCVVTFLLSYVVPSITAIFIEMEHNLPWPTQLLILISGFLRLYFWPITIVLCATICAAAAYLRTEKGKTQKDRLVLKLPLLGDMIIKSETQRFAATLAALLSTGSDILSALNTAGQIIQNRIIKSAVKTIVEQVQKGISFAHAIRSTDIFGPIVYHMVATGQKSADLEGALSSLAQMYEQEIDNRTKMITSLIEPAILLCMGAVVGFIVLAILLPIFEINQMI